MTLQTIFISNTIVTVYACVLFGLASIGLGFWGRSLYRRDSFFTAAGITGGVTLIIIGAAVLVANLFKESIISYAVLQAAGLAFISIVVIMLQNFRIIKRKGEYYALVYLLSFPVMIFLFFIIIFGLVFSQLEKVIS